VGPEELLGDGVLADGAQVAEIRPILEVEVEAVAEAGGFLSVEHDGVHSEGIAILPSAFLVTSKHVLSDWLGEPQREVARGNLALLLLQFFRRDLGHELLHNIKSIINYPHLSTSLLGRS